MPLRFRLAPILALLVVSLTPAIAQDESPSSPPKKEQPPDGPAPKPLRFATDHTLALGARSLAYAAVAETTVLEDDKGRPRPSSSRSPTWRRVSPPPSGRSPSPSTAGRDPRRFGCTWVCSGRSTCRSRATARPRAPRRTRSSTTQNRCSSRAISCSSTRSARGSRASSSRARTPTTGASTRTRGRSRASSAATSRATIAGLRRSTCSGRATAGSAGRSSSASCRAGRTPWPSTGSFSYRPRSTWSSSTARTTTPRSRR